MIWKYLIPLSFVLLTISFWNRNDLSNDMTIVEELRQEPSQRIAKKISFSTTINNIEYKIQPLFEYELYGLVVSYELHDGNYNLHKRWNDHLNVADYCVVWDKSAFTEFLPKIKFWNGQFTCNFETRNQHAWDNFNTEQLSNNHLISDDEYIRKKLRKINIGDQIRITGWLSSYENLSNGGLRSTSITRKDQGNGACETIYVNDVRVLKSYNSMWRYVMYLSLFMFIISLFMYIRAPHTARNK
ncbi:MAG: hypothetical protein AB8B92_05900 [Gammaproteobacteria bacterium]